MSIKPDGSRNAMITALANEIVSLCLDHPTRVAVDGRSAAGKTTLSDELAEAVRALGRGVLRASIDDFHYPGHKYRSGKWTPRSYYDQGFDYISFGNFVLQPLGPGGSRRCRMAFWDAFYDKEVPKQWHRAGERDIAIIDGVFLLRPELAGHWDYVIWLDIDNETMVNRAVERDVAWVGSTQVVEERYRRFWVPMHELYEQLTSAPSHAHAFVDNRVLQEPRLLRLSKLNEGNDSEME
jgi:uridine kinase